MSQVKAKVLIQEQLHEQIEELVDEIPDLQAQMTNLKKDISELKNPHAVPPSKDNVHQTLPAKKRPAPEPTSQPPPKRPATDSTFRVQRKADLDKLAAKQLAQKNRSKQNINDK